MDYSQAGVDVERGYETVRRIKKHVLTTMNERVLGGLGSFGGLYTLEGMDIPKPVLVSGTDGVGTKLKLAFALDKHDTVGIDCVAMSVNDVICQGAKPLFFLDYVATGRLSPEQIEEVVAGVAQGCRQANCALIGGETAEMPGFYNIGEYDLAGFCVGIADRDALLNPVQVQEGDALIGIASSGAHSNGYSLIRRLVPEDAMALNEIVPELGVSWGEALLKPTRIYVKAIEALRKECAVHGLAHITGGGLIENVPRALPGGLMARIQNGSWPIPPLFTLLAERSGLPDHKLYNTWNMGIGMVCVVPAEQAESAIETLVVAGERAYRIGEVVHGEDGIEFV